MRPLSSGALLQVYLILLLPVKPPSMFVTNAGIRDHLTPWKKRPATLLPEPLTLCTPLLGRREALRRLHLSVGKYLCSVNPRTLLIHVTLTAVSLCLRQGTCRKPLPFALAPSGGSGSTMFCLLVGRMRHLFASVSGTSRLFIMTRGVFSSALFVVQLGSCSLACTLRIGLRRRAPWMSGG